jgi:RNA polymerase sigma-32 factor
VKIGTTAIQKKLFFNLRKVKNQISALEEGDLHPDHIELITRRLGVSEKDVVEMNQRLIGDFALNARIREEGDFGEWQDNLVDEASDQEFRLAEGEESEKRRRALAEALTSLDDRERRIFEARRLADEPVTLDKLAIEFGVSPERIRQIEVRAFQKMRTTVQFAMARRRPSLAIHWARRPPRRRIHVMSGAR